MWLLKADMSSTIWSLALVDYSLLITEVYTSVIEAYIRHSNLDVRSQDRVIHSDVYYLSEREGISGEEIPFSVRHLKALVYIHALAVRLTLVTVLECSVGPVGRTNGIP